MASCTVEKIAQVSDAGIGGAKPYTGNYPALILDTLRQSRKRNGLSTEAIGASLGVFYDERKWEKGQEAEVLDALRHLIDLGLVSRSGELWIAKKGRV
jgi:hypothetical protein